MLPFNTIAVGVDGTNKTITTKQCRNFLLKIRFEANGCWFWLAHKDKDGYGTFTLWPFVVKAHRVSYSMFVGMIPDEYQIDHTCWNTSCVNPAHLVPVPYDKNPRRKSNKTHCIHGHEMTDENTYTWFGDKLCRTCRRVANRESQAKNARA